VTGAAGGIGWAIARRLAHDGWFVVPTDLDQTALDRAVATSGHGPQLLPLTMDVSDRASVMSVSAVLGERNRPVAGLVNAAGLLQDVQSFFAMEPEQQKRIWDVNYFGAVTCTQIFGAAMAGSGGGSIVNITSINEHRPLPLHAYAPTKVALGALTALTAGEFGPLGIRVNAIAPGFTLTPVLKDKIATGKRDVGVIEDHTAMGRLIDPEEIASVASFLMSDDAKAVTGASIPVDAGWMATSHWMNFAALKGPASTAE
jgi:NAD(P)-dependent dehydrogenase (short-subunit alcohol dehydrogenase family)